MKEVGMHIGVSGRTFTVSEPGGAVGVALQFAARLPDHFNNSTLFGHSSLSSRFNSYDIVSTGLPLQSLYYGTLWEQMVLPTLGRKRGIDLLFCPNAVCPLRRTDFEVVVAIQDIPEYHGFGSSRYVQFRKALLPRVVQRADHIITVSDFTRQDLCNHLSIEPEDISVVHNGIDPIYLEESTPDISLDVPTPFLLYVGAMSDRKNIAGIIKAFAQFKQEHSAAHSLVLVGPEKNSTYDVLDPSSIAPTTRESIYRPGYFTKQELRKAYYEADAFVFPSHHESFGLPPLEAAACGTPVVTSRAGAIPEILGEHAHFVNPDEPADIAEGIKEAVFAAESPQIAHRAKERAKEFTWDRATTELVNVLRSVKTN